MSRGLVRAMVLCGALCALGAVGASAALAAPGEFTIGAAPSTITGNQVTPSVFEITNRAGEFLKIKCKISTLEGTASSASGTDLSLTPTNSECNVGLPVVIRMNGCKYTFTGVAERTANLDIVGCTTGKTITWTFLNCTVSVPEQSGLAHVVFTSEGSGSAMDALATVTISNMKSTQTGSECFAPGLTSSDTRWSGTILLKAFNDGGSRVVTKHEHTYSEVICGTEVSFTVD